MLVHELKKSTGFNKKAKVLGRGNSSGKGNYSGKGLKGQAARSGASIPAWFEGGQTPLIRRLPKLRWFKRFHKFIDAYEIVNLDRLEADVRIGSETTVTKQVLVATWHISSVTMPVKVLSRGKLTKKLVFEGLDQYSVTARKHIEQAGGSIV